MPAQNKGPPHSIVAKRHENRHLPTFPTKICTKYKVQDRPKIAQNRHNGTVFRMPFPKICTSQKNSIH